MFGILFLGDPSTGTLAVDTICISQVRALEIGNGEFYNVGSGIYKSDFVIVIFRNSENSNMSEKLSKHDTEVWQRLVESQKEFNSASRMFLSSDIDRVSLMREKLYSLDRDTAFYFLPYLKEEELMQIFDILVPLASTAHSSVGRVKEAILSLPHDWIIKKIEQLVEPLLIDGTDDEYRRFLELYFELDKDLTLKLAHRAAQHTDLHIKEAGEDYLEIFEKRQE